MYKCSVCNYEYTESAGEFEALGDDYLCPVCGVGKEMFELV
jgi:rubredoxin